jgi:hypothetical protein
MPRPGDTERDRLDSAQVDELLRALLEDEPRSEPSPARWNSAFCASGGKTPMCL